MNKILIGTIGVIILAATAWLFFQHQTTDYVAQISDEVEALEMELATLEAAVHADTLEPEQAAKAQTKIVARIDTINTAANASQQIQLTDAEKAQLALSLQRLADALTHYKATLEVVDQVVLTLPESKRPQLRHNGSGQQGVVTITDDVVADIGAQIDEIIDDIEDEALAAEVADATDDAAMDDVNDSETTTETMETNTDDTDDTNDTGTNDEVMTDDATADTADSPDATSTEDAADVSIEADGDIQL